MSRIAAIGDWDTIQVFRAWGADILPAATRDEVAGALRRCREAEVQLVFLTEGAYAAAREEADRANAEFLPAVCLIPDAGGSLDLAGENLRRASRRAIGADIQ